MVVIIKGVLLKFYESNSDILCMETKMQILEYPDPLVYLNIIKVKIQTITISKMYYRYAAALEAEIEVAYFESRNFL